jgi:retinol dehydrogenase-12
MWLWVGCAALLCCGLALRTWMRWRMHARGVCGCPLPARPGSVHWEPAAGILRGRVAIVTGANTGIGRETAAALARAGAHVVMACRSAARGADAAAAIRTELGRDGGGGGGVTVMPLDLTSFASVASFTAAVQAAGFAARGVHILVANAGVNSFGALDPPVTEDGIEALWQSNFLGHYLLVQLLTPLLRRGAAASGAPSRVVLLSSVMHRSATVGGSAPPDFGPFFSRRTPLTYSASKLAMNLLALRLNATAYADGAVIAVCANPGGVMSDIWRGAPRWWFPLLRLVLLSTWEGARASVHAAAAEGVRAGDYFVPYAGVDVMPTPFEYLGPFAGVRAARAAAAAYDGRAAEALWALAARACGAWLPADDGSAPASPVVLRLPRLPPPPAHGDGDEDGGRAARVTAGGSSSGRGRRRRSASPAAAASATPRRPAA